MLGRLLIFLFVIASLAVTVYPKEKNDVNNEQNVGILLYNCNVEFSF